MQTKEIKMTSIQVTFTNAVDEVIGTIDFQKHMTLFVSVGLVEEMCEQFREQFNHFGDSLNFRIEYISEDD
jgi:hypothetical protein